MKTEIHADSALTRRDWRDNDHRPEYTLDRMEMPTAEGEFVFNLIQHWGMVAARDDGEDSTGRKQLALMPTEEVVDRACAMSAQAFAALRNRGWLVPNPVAEHLIAEQAARDAERAD